MPEEKGQIVAYDFLIGMLIFLVVFGFVQAKWQETENAMESQSLELELKRNTVNEAEKLVSTPGRPGNWESDPAGASEVGFAVYPGKIVKEKLSAFGLLDYDSQKKKMGLEQYGFYLKVEQEKTSFETGIDSNSGRAYSTQRVVEYNGKPARLSLKLYRK